MSRVYRVFHEVSFRVFVFEEIEFENHVYIYIGISLIFGWTEVNSWQSYNYSMRKNKCDQKCGITFFFYLKLHFQENGLQTHISVKDFFGNEFSRSIFSKWTRSDKILFFIVSCRIILFSAPIRYICILHYIYNTLYQIYI